MINKLCQLWFLILSLLTSCVGKKEIQKTKDSGSMEEERFYYEVSCSAPRLAPGEYVHVKYIGETETFKCFGNEHKTNGMGNGQDGVCRSKLSRYRLPKSIDAIWISYTDRKTYSFKSMIPYDTIVSLFKDGGEPCVPVVKLTDKNNSLTDIMSELDLCFLPEGKVVLYVKAAKKTILLDWSAVGTEVTDDEILSDVYGRWGLKNMDNYYDEYYSNEFPDYESWRSYVRKHGSLAPLLERYFQRFNYTLNFEFENKETKIYEVGSDFMNGERYGFTSKYNEPFKMPSRLKEFEVLWDTKDSRYTCFMYFNEEEMLKVFDEAYGEDRSQKGELKIKVCKYNNLFDISLNVGDKSIKLEKTEIRVFQDPIEKPDGKGTLIYKNYEGNHKNLFADDEKYVGE